MGAGVFLDPPEPSEAAEQLRNAGHRTGTGDR
jgi:hypothetical protein